MTMREAERRVEQRGAGPSLRLGLVGGLVGAATCFVALTFTAHTSPATAHAAQPALEDRPRGLISARTSGSRSSSDWIASTRIWKRCLLMERQRRKTRATRRKP